MKGLDIILVTSTLTVIATGQSLRTRSLPTQSGELSMIQAYDRAVLACNNVGIATPSRNKASASLRALRTDVSTLRLWRIDLGREMILSVHSRTGAIASVNNIKRGYERHRKLGRTGSVFFSSAEGAKAHVLSIARKLGVPNNWQISNFRIRRDNEGGAGWGITGGVFEDSNGKNIGTIAVDTQDGVLLSFTRSKF